MNFIKLRPGNYYVKMEPSQYLLSQALVGIPFLIVISLMQMGHIRQIHLPWVLGEHRTDIDGATSSSLLLLEICLE